MISCTEFIPAYSELFKFIEEKGGGHDAVVRYWEHISDTYVADRLGEEVTSKGILGCFDYWSHSLNEEAADFTMTLDRDKGEFEIDMRHCPSKSLLLSLKHMEPYYDYCGHCELLYSRVLARHNIICTNDLSECDKSKCKLSIKK